MEFSRQEHWNGLLFPPPGDLPNPGIEPVSLTSSALAGGFFTTAPPGKPQKYINIVKVKYSSRCNLEGKGGDFLNVSLFLIYKQSVKKNLLIIGL